MSQNITTELQHLGILAVSGTDAVNFLQGQLTCDVKILQSGDNTLGACCTPQGRVIASFILLQDQDTYSLYMDPELVEILLQHFKKYAVFFKKMSLNSVAPTNQDPTVTNAWHLKNVRAGIGHISKATSGLFTPHMLNYHQIGAISFKKGCYTGQEIIARTQYLGKIKKHLYHAQVKTTMLPSPNTELLNAQAQAVGTVIQAALTESNDIELLAVIQENATENPIYLKTASGPVLLLIKSQ